jgi:hypothetical protein
MNLNEKENKKKTKALTGDQIDQKKDKKIDLTIKKRGYNPHRLVDSITKEETPDN